MLAESRKQDLVRLRLELSECLDKCSTASKNTEYRQQRLQNIFDFARETISSSLRSFTILIYNLTLLSSLNLDFH